MLKSPKVLSTAVLVTVTYSVDSLVNLRSSSTQNQRGSHPQLSYYNLLLFRIDKFAIGIKEIAGDTAHDGH
jgi:hypothetical protein